jgi:hypothetical protein
VTRLQRNRGSIFYEVGDIFFSPEYKPHLRSTEPPAQSISCSLSQEVKQPGREADHMASPSSEAEHTWKSEHTSSPQSSLQRGVA